MVAECPLCNRIEFSDELLDLIPLVTQSLPRVGGSLIFFFVVNVRAAPTARVTRACGPAM
jgi:hypothetical protein